MPSNAFNSFCGIVLQGVGPTSLAAAATCSSRRLEPRDPLPRVTAASCEERLLCFQPDVQEGPRQLEEYVFWIFDTFPSSCTVNFQQIRKSSKILYVFGIHLNFYDRTKDEPYSTKSSKTGENTALAKQQLLLGSSK